MFGFSLNSLGSSWKGKNIFSNEGAPIQNPIVRLPAVLIKFLLVVCIMHND
jgi:hypothetical protein